MKVWVVTSRNYDGGNLDGEHSVIYSTYEEAKKCFDEYVKVNVLDDEFFKDKISENSEHYIEYHDGRRWSYTLSICEDDLEIYDKFDPKQLSKL